MKKTVTVTIEKQFEIEIDDEHLTQEKLADFSSYMFAVGGVDDLFKYAGEQIARYENCFIEGIGPAKKKVNKKDEPVLYREIYDDASVDVTDVSSE